MSPRRLVAAAAAGSVIVVLALSTLSGAAAVEPRSTRAGVVPQSLSAAAPLPQAGVAGGLAVDRSVVRAVPQAVTPSPSASPKRAGNAAVVPARSPRVPNRFVIYAVYLLALVAVGLVVLWAALGWRERPPRIDPREPA